MLFSEKTLVPLFASLDVICQKNLNMLFLDAIPWCYMFKILKDLDPQNAVKACWNHQKFYKFIFKVGHGATSSETQSKYFSCQHRCQLSFKFITTSNHQWTFWELLGPSGSLRNNPKMCHMQIFHLPPMIILTFVTVCEMERSYKIRYHRDFEYIPSSPRASE